MGGDELLICPILPGLVLGFSFMRSRQQKLVLWFSTETDPSSEVLETMTTIVFFVDENCSDRGDLGNVTGPPTGYCTAFGVQSFGSFRVETLERTCAGEYHRMKSLTAIDRAT